MNVIFTHYCYSHISEGFISYLYTTITLCILVIRYEYSPWFSLHLFLDQPPYYCLTEILCFPMVFIILTNALPAQTRS
jgi:hypothetical protein